MGFPSRDLLREIVEPLAADHGVDLKDVEVTPAGRRRRVSVVVDADGGVDLDRCAEVSRVVSAALDESEVMGETPYTLEVSSPGCVPAADDAPALATQRGTAGQARPARRWRPRGPHRDRGRHRRDPGRSTAPSGGWPTTRSAQPESRSSSAAPTRWRSDAVDIDLSVLRALEREKEISFDLVVEALEQALLVAYERTGGARAHARVQLDRKSGHVTVWAQEVDERAPSCPNGTTHPRDSAASRRPPRSR